MSCTRMMDCYINIYKEEKKEINRQQPYYDAGQADDCVLDAAISLLSVAV